MLTHLFLIMDVALAKIEGHTRARKGEQRCLQGGLLLIFSFPVGFMCVQPHFVDK